jgi:hypothetical protein
MASAASGEQSGVSPSTPILEDGTPVKLRISQTVSSADAHVDDRVEFEVLEEITVANVVVIPKGGIAWGTVTEAQGKRRMARGGKLEIVMDSVRLVDGEKAALRAVKDAKGGGHAGAMTAGIVATGLLFWPAAPFFLFMHGKDTTIPKGTEVPTFISGNFRLESSRFPQSIGAAVSSQPGRSTTRATVSATSVPAGAEIYLDQSFVGNTPSSIDVAVGKHLISIKKSGFKNWEREILVTGGNVSLAAELLAGSTIVADGGGKSASASSSSSVATEVPTSRKEWTIQPAQVAKVVETPPPGWIGLSTKKAKDGGAAISSVVPYGPAAKSGLRIGDIITELNGTPVTDQDFDAAVARYKSGSKLRVSYMRDYWNLETILTVAVAGS